MFADAFLYFMIPFLLANWHYNSMPAPTAGQRKLVSALGDASFKVREAAFKKLKAEGAVARSAIEQYGIKSDDLEIRVRSGRLLAAHRDVYGGQEIPAIYGICGLKPFKLPGGTMFIPPRAGTAWRLYSDLGGPEWEYDDKVYTVAATQKLVDNMFLLGMSQHDIAAVIKEMNKHLPDAQFYTMKFEDEKDRHQDDGGGIIIPIRVPGLWPGR